MQEVGEFPTFPEAFRTFYNAFNEQCEKGGIPERLASASWIVVDSDFEGAPCRAPLMTDRIVELGHSFGFLDPEGNLLKEIPEVSQEELTRAFAGLPMQLLANDLKNMVQEQQEP